MTETTTTTAETCRNGHPRTPENTRTRLHRARGKESVIRQCLACAREAKAARKADPGAVSGIPAT